MSDVDPSPPRSRVAIPRHVLDGPTQPHIEVVWDYNPEVTTYRLTHRPGDVDYLKVATPSWQPSLADEDERMRWAAEHLPVPEVVGVGRDAGAQWLRTRALVLTPLSWAGPGSA